MLKTFKLSMFRYCMAALLAVVVFGILPPVANAQEVVGGGISGIITDSQGPVAGAAVMIKGGSGGVMTGVDGDYVLTGVKPGDIIVVSLLGYEELEIPYNGQAVLNAVLNVSSEFLDEVVVTALGIKREEKTLAYNVQQVKAEELTAVKDANFVNSLVGKVAGVQIQSGASGPGSSTRVVMRGMKSIEKNNTVLYVIDGIPMYNKSFGGSGGAMESPTGSEAAADINPDDIESVNMLTGPSAAALYGSEAANGVIIINTKRGSEGKTTLTVSNSTTFSTAYMMPEMQSRYGMSANGESWGPALSSDYSFDPRKFFNTGTNVINSVSLSTGNEKNQTYISASTTNSTGIVPGSKYNRYNFSARNTTKFLNDKLILDFGASFIIQNDHNLVSQGTYYNPITGLYLFPRGEDFNEVRAYERWSSAQGRYVQYWPYGAGVHNIQNPYWVQNRNNRDMNKRRYMLNASLQYNITDWINVVARVRTDESTYRNTREYYASTNQTFCGENGGFYLEKSSDRSFYGDIIANIDKKWGDWRLIANVGGSINDQRYESNMEAGDLLIANHFATNNLNVAEKYKRNESAWHDQTQSVFASVEVGWRNALFLTLTGRNDWASQLAFSDQSSFFYPSVGLSAVISELAPMPQWFTFLKVRGSFSDVSTPFARFISNPSFEYNDQTNTWTQSKIYPYRNLKPESTRSWELGLNMRFLESLSLDVTYYRSNTYNQTVYGNLAASSGYEKFIAQAGNVQNQGVELALGYTNNWGGFGWDSGLTFTFNENKIIELANDIKNPITGEIVDIPEIQKEFIGQNNVAPRVILRKGGSLSDIYVNHLIARDANGNVLINSDGTLSMEDVGYMKVGSLAPKANLGWTNTFSYGGLSLGIVLTARIGGLVYSATQGILDYYGVSETSAVARDNGGIPVNYGMMDARLFYNKGISTSGGGHGAYYLYDATNIRLQELALNYTLPSKWFKDKMRMTVGFVARNLAMIYCKAPFDPELSASTQSNYYQGVDYFMLPSTRNFGFNVKFQF
ncbi:MAG: SusC/RagA family TonB-linked outer membrane protein [Bacteroidales bacterium]|nr:SusC/RagA family TonB-linked outer membrane protein [Bacteroidales bacterium]